jgi:hypothetical protein
MSSALPCVLRERCLQVFAEIAIIVLDEFTPAQRSWFAWRDVMHFLDIACCAAILFPIVWRIKHLREAAMTDGKAEQCAATSQHTHLQS